MQKRWLKITLVALCVLGILIAGAVGYGYWLYRKAYNRDEQAFKTLVGIGYKNFPKIDLAWASLHSTNLSRTSLIGAELSSANLDSANLYKTNLSSANLFFAKLSSVNLDSANLSFANLDSAYLYEANLPLTYLGNCKNLTPKQLSWCKNIENICGLSQEFLEEVRKLNPELMQWWDGESREMSVDEWHKRTE